MRFSLRCVGNLERRVRRNRVAGQRLFTQIVIKILGLQAPMFIDADFNAAAGGPSGFGFVGRRGILDGPLRSKISVIEIVYMTICQTAVP